ncbi:HNH endonuclease [Serinibacter arcticus]|uniref:HNH nuclease domain-containing protein n=1 Tax=Serinibacter arcticus TaxID=1655435 RepID=A0A4Z1E0S6_9MICO|nr:HNH endonuclease signature motif containing protein [Serinibacter arcticus]TGO04252.1 hypothetical protein SERN_1845 [Serinibacter arcticus]
MFDSASGSAAGDRGGERLRADDLALGSIASLSSALVGVALARATVTSTPGTLGTHPSGADLVDVIAALERLKAAATAAQARLSADLDREQRAAQRAAGLPAKQQGAGIGGQIALARGQSPHAGQTLLGVAKALTTEMPHTLNALATGTLDEWRATVLVRESACLDVADRQLLDRELCGDAAALVGVGARSLAARARRIAQRLDAAALVRRARRAVADRCVTIRPAPDTMVYLTALLPVAQGVGAYAALTQAADAARSGGDVRSRGQVMADTLVGRLTGREVVEAVPLQVGLVMTDAALLAPPGSPGRNEPARLTGYGPVPAPWARDLVASTLGKEPERVWLRRLFTRPGSNQLAALESRSRSAPAGLRDFVSLRDDTCRTPWCDAPILHVDHVVDHHRGGATDSANLQGLCEACNYAKTAPGWSATSTDAVVTTTTPTGHRYASTAPDLPGPTTATATATATASKMPSMPSPRRRRPPDYVRNLDLTATVSAIEAYLASRIPVRVVEVEPHPRT